MFCSSCLHVCVCRLLRIRYLIDSGLMKRLYANICI
nr:MAG TPA: protein of unknown function (DUF2087) [Caudoviricetes sp.]